MPLKDLFTWKLHGNGTTVGPDNVVAADERLSFPVTLGIGLQHVIAMFGGVFIVPVIMGFPTSTALLFSGVGTIVFLLLTANRVPSYLGSSFAFIAPVAVIAPLGQQGTLSGDSLALALGGILIVGLALSVVGLIVHFVGARWISTVMPPVVTGTIVALIGFNLAGVAKNEFDAGPIEAIVTVVAILLVAVLFRGLLGRLSIILGVVAGYIVAALRGAVDFTGVENAAWFGLPTFQTPHISPAAWGLFLPVVLVLVAENVGHVKTVAAMTGKNLDRYMGRALLADGLSTTLAGLGGGTATTTYAENIGVMAASRVYSTLAYWVAAIFAILLSLSPKFGALAASIPTGVLGGAGVVLYGMIGVMGARIWVQNRVNYSSPTNLLTAGVGLVLGIGGFVFTVGDFSIGAIGVGSFAAIIIYHAMRAISRVRDTDPAIDTPAPEKADGGEAGLAPFETAR
ncbi:uracil-xanthine permease family protein [Agreia pratensis]|uniref:Nucleobase:cation symporter-2, NCS2 family n=1 Tax=Agreia pratensis TaxID=150121 RepID=A0A1X7KY47_9MICO|nr:solute carrier family 23 protein [Agreia pratensis]SMG46558.1 nucleobase:cation symporter-2, NCS2 family [Agreia pratensis]